mgnify:CR=1 FL=1
MILEGAAQMLASLIKEIGDHLPEMLVSGIEMFASLRKGAVGKLAGYIREPWGKPWWT